MCSITSTSSTRAECHDGGRFPCRCVSGGGGWGERGRAQGRGMRAWRSKAISPAPPPLPRKAGGRSATVPPRIAGSITTAALGAPLTAFNRLRNRCWPTPNRCVPGALCPLLTVTFTVHSAPFHFPRASLPCTQATAAPILRVVSEPGGFFPLRHFCTSDSRIRGKKRAPRGHPPFASDAVSSGPSPPGAPMARWRTGPHVRGTTSGALAHDRAHGSKHHQYCPPRRTLWWIYRTQNVRKGQRVTPPQRHMPPYPHDSIGCPPLPRPGRPRLAPAAPFS